jgi:large subunit ribosomal protein L24
VAANSKRLQHNSIGEKGMQATKRVKNPRKQRKMLYNAPAHMRHKFLGARLSNELIASRGIKTLPVRKGDTIRIVRGDNAGFEGKVSRVDLKRYRIFVEGLTREKVDGTNIFVSVHPSKVMIRSLNLDDKWRKAIVERKQALAEETRKEEKAKKLAPKPAKKRAAVKKEELVKEPTVAAAAEEKLPAEKPKAKPKAAPKKRVAKKKEEAPLTEKKPAARKKKETAPAAEEKPAEKEAKPKAVKKTPTKRKTAASEKKEGGT